MIDGSVQECDERGVLRGRGRRRVPGDHGGRRLLLHLHPGDAAVLLPLHPGYVIVLQYLLAR